MAKKQKANEPEPEDRSNWQKVEGTLDHVSVMQYPQLTIYFKDTSNSPLHLLSRPYDCYQDVSLSIKDKTGYTEVDVGDLCQWISEQKGDITVTLFTNPHKYGHVEEVSFVAGKPWHPEEITQMEAKHKQSDSENTPHTTSQSS